jgi:hypothetical protein
MGYQARCLQIGRAGAIARTCEAKFDGRDPIQMRDLITVGSRSAAKSARFLLRPGGWCWCPCVSPEPLMSPALRSLDQLDQQQRQGSSIHGQEEAAGRGANDEGADRQEG